MRRTLRYGLIGASVLLLTGVAPVSAADRHHVTITAPTTFDGIPDTFTATGIRGCAGGVVEDGPGHVQFAPPQGIFAGFKVFWCDAEDTGFVLRLNARFGDGGSIGTWSVVDSWGEAAGMRGAGRLVGDPIDNGILDHYHGIVTR